MDERLALLRSSIKSAQESLSQLETITESDALTKESSTQVRDLLIKSQASLQAAFSPLKVIRRDLYLLQPESQVTIPPVVAPPST